MVRVINLANTSGSRLVVKRGVSVYFSDISSFSKRGCCIRDADNIVLLTCFRNRRSIFRAYIFSHVEEISGIRRYDSFYCLTDTFSNIRECYIYAVYCLELGSRGKFVATCYTACLKILILVD